MQVGYHYLENLNMIHVLANLLIPCLRKRLTSLRLKI